MDISEDEFNEIAKKAAEDAKSTTTTSQTPTATETGQPTSTTDPGKGDDNNGGLSTTAKIGIAVGATVAGVALIAGVAFFLYRRHRAANEFKEEANPMLGRHSLQPSTFSGRNSGANSVAATSMFPPGYNEWKQDVSPQNNYSASAWGPDSFTTGGGGGNPTGMSPPQQQWNESPAPAWNPQTGWGPQPNMPAPPQQPQAAAQSWMAPAGYHAVASHDGAVAGRDDPQNGVYELASTPAEYRPRNALPRPAEMPGSNV